MRCFERCPAAIRTGENRNPPLEAKAGPASNGGRVALVFRSAAATPAGSAADRLDEFENPLAGHRVGDAVVGAHELEGLAARKLVGFEGLLLAVPQARVTNHTPRIASARLIALRHQLAATRRFG